jgi:hypothetical protein
MASTLEWRFRGEEKGRPREQDSRNGLLESNDFEIRASSFHDRLGRGLQGLCVGIDRDTDGNDYSFNFPNTDGNDYSFRFTKTDGNDFSFPNTDGNDFSFPNTDRFDYSFNFSNTDRFDS